MIDLSAHWVEGLQVQYKPVAPVATAFPLYRQPHDLELVKADPGAYPSRTDRNYTGNSNGLARERIRTAPPEIRTIPEVFNMLPLHETPLSPAWVDLICACNPEIQPDKVRLIVTDPHWAFNNDGTAPAFDKPRLCGGALVTGYEQDGNLHIYSLLTGQPVPTAEYVLSRPYLWYYGVAVNREGQLSHMTLGSNGNRIPIKVPIVTRMPVYVPLRWLHRLEPGNVPGPLWMS